MTFEYSEYLNGDLIWPLFVTVFNLFVVSGTVCSLVRAAKKDELDRLMIIRGAIGLIVICFLLVVCVGPLFNGGIHLIYEREDDALIAYGTIERIDDYPGLLENSSKYTTEYGTTFGNRLTISGVTFRIVTSGKLRVGDEVRVRFLPNSGYILQIEKTG